MTDHSRSSRYPDRSAGSSGWPLTSFGLVCSTLQPRSPTEAPDVSWRGRCPVHPGRNSRLGQLLRDRGSLSRRSFVTSLTRHMTSEPSRASWRLDLRLTRTFQGQLFHPQGASPRRDGPTAHRLPVQAMEISSHCISALRGAPAPANHCPEVPQACADRLSSG